MPADGRHVKSDGGAVVGLAPHREPHLARPRSSAARPARRGRGPRSAAGCHRSEASSPSSGAANATNCHCAASTAHGQRHGRARRHGPREPRSPPMRVRRASTVLDHVAPRVRGTGTRRSSSSTTSRAAHLPDPHLGTQADPVRHRRTRQRLHVLGDDVVPAASAARGRARAGRGRVRRAGWRRPRPAGAACWPRRATPRSATRRACTVTCSTASRMASRSCGVHHLVDQLLRRAPVDAGAAASKPLRIPRDNAVPAGS